MNRICRVFGRFSIAARWLQRGPGLRHCRLRRCVARGRRGRRARAHAHARLFSKRAFVVARAWTEEQRRGVLRTASELVDAEGFTGEALTVYRLVAEADLPPSVEILAPAEDLPLERDLRIEISAVAADDVGLARLDLVWRHDGAEQWERIALLGATDPSVVGLEIDRGESLAITGESGSGKSTLALACLGLLTTAAVLIFALVRGG